MLLLVLNSVKSFQLRQVFENCCSFVFQINVSATISRDWINTSAAFVSKLFKLLFVKQVTFRAKTGLPRVLLFCSFFDGEPSKNITRDNNRIFLDFQLLSGGSPKQDFAVLMKTQALSCETVLQVSFFEV